MIADPHPLGAERGPEGRGARARAGRPGVLVVDDPGVRALLECLLREEGYAVWPAADGYEALHIYAGPRDGIGLVVIDVRMPGLDGPQTLAALRQVGRRLRCCFLTGGPSPYSEEDLRGHGADHVHYKPFRLDELAATVRALVGGPGPGPLA